MTKEQKIGLIVGVVVVVIVISIISFRYHNPGIYFKYTCNEGGDDSRKFYDPNWQARGAVCDGLFIPFGVNLNGKDKKDILAKMGELYSQDSSLKTNMPVLAETAVLQLG